MKKTKIEVPLANLGTVGRKRPPITTKSNITIVKHVLVLSSRSIKWTLLKSVINI